MRRPGVSTEPKAVLVEVPRLCAACSLVETGSDAARLLVFVAARLEFHYTPRHASWLNMVEIEIGVLRSQCLDRRIENKATLIAEIAAWERRRNREKAKIKWMFTTEKAREKLRKAYPVKEP